MSRSLPDCPPPALYLHPERSEAGGIFGGPAVMGCRLESTASSTRKLPVHGTFGTRISIVKAVPDLDRTPESAYC
jgi:hypothetical protein